MVVGVSIIWQTRLFLETTSLRVGPYDVCDCGIVDRITEMTAKNGIHSQTQNVRELTIIWLKCHLPEKEIRLFGENNPGSSLQRGTTQTLLYKHSPTLKQHKHAKEATQKASKVSKTKNVDWKSVDMRKYHLGSEVVGKIRKTKKSEITSKTEFCLKRQVTRVKIPNSSWATRWQGQLQAGLCVDNFPLRSSCMWRFLPLFVQQKWTALP